MVLRARAGCGVREQAAARIVDQELGPGAVGLGGGRLDALGRPCSVPRGTRHTSPHRTGHRKKPILLRVPLQIDELPLQFMQARRLDVLAEMARLRVLHEETHARVHGTARTAAEDQRRLAAAKKACKEAVKKFRISRGRKR